MKVGAPVKFYQSFMFGNSFLSLSALIAAAPLITGCLQSGSILQAKSKSLSVKDDVSAPPTPYVAETVESLGFTRPNPEPPLPSDFPAFNPPQVAIDPTLATSQVSEWMRTGNPGEAIPVSGSSLDSSGLGFGVFSQARNNDGVLLQSEVLNHDSKIANVFKLPSQLSADSMYVVYPQSGGKAGRPFAINRTEAWWSGPDSVVPGTKASVFGRHFVLGNTSRAKIYLKPVAGVSGSWITPSQANPFRLDFTVPSSTANGDYEIWVHNGSGGHFGWSGPVALKLTADPWAWNSTVFNVKNYGAVGDGVTDDAAAIRSALAAAGAVAMSSVYFPTGTYLMNSTLVPPSKVRWYGDGKSSSIIKVGSGFVANAPGTSDQNHLAPITTIEFMNANHIEFKDLTLDANKNLNGGMKTLVYMRGATDVKFTGVRLKTDGYDDQNYSTGDFQNSHHISMSGTEIHGGLLFLGTAYQFFVDSSQFYMGRNAVTSIHSFAAREVSLTNNTFQDIDPAHTGDDRIFTMQSHQGRTKNIYISGNTSRNYAPGPGFVNDNAGEQILFEIGAAALSANVTAASDTTFKLSDSGRGSVDLTQIATSDVAIVGGTGMGQHRELTSYNSATKTFSISIPWRIRPDSSSVVAISPIAKNSVIYRNTFQGKSDYATRYTASTAVNMYGGCHDIIVDSNTIENTRAGVTVYSVGTPVLMNSSFNLVSNNTITGTLNGLISPSDYLPTPAMIGAMGQVGNTFRKNTISQATVSAIQVHGCTPDSGGVQLMNVYENNSSRNSKLGIFLSNKPDFANAPTNPADHGTTAVFLGNSFDRGSVSASSSAAVSTAPGCSFLDEGNQFTGFAASSVTGP
ncbi:MAG: hypothetical protein EOP09_02605 [Proteobacteria bacterium]|nr:MAG: hypothetical protein EOP09_02605 [Pseudomonadota bacterium]